MTAASATSYPGAAAALERACARAERQTLRPPPKLSLSQWAERYGVLSLETSAETGRFRAYAYQTGIMDAITDPAIETVTVMKAARVGYTKILDHAVGYYLHQDPSPVMVVQPRVEDAEDYSKTEIAPMLRDTEVLAAITPDPKAKDSGQTILRKTFLNGASLRLVGANSPGGFRRTTVRVVLFDEVDGYPVGGAGSEGDQIKLGTKRTETFWNRKIVIGSTPTVKGVSRIERSYETSDQRRYYVPCPHCGEKQPLEWGGQDTPHGVKWEKDEAGNHLPETAYYVCRHNGCVIDEADKAAMIAAGRWVAAKPFKGHAGFHISALYSLSPNATWGRLVAEFLEAKRDPQLLQTFVNLVLGETWEAPAEQEADAGGLMARREAYAAEVPDGVAVLTAGVDVQGDRLEVEVVGWGRDEESWSIDHIVLPGDPAMPEVWADLDRALLRAYRRVDGRPFVVDAACVDTGGHHTQQAYDFCRARLGRRIWAVKGESARGGARSPVWPARKPTRKLKTGFRPYIIGVNAAKDTIYARLALTEPGPGYCHFPADRDAGYFAQLTAEKSFVRTERGQRFRVWVLPSGRANEALDLRVYAYAALCGLTAMGLKLNRRADQMAVPHAGPPPDPAPAAPQPPALPAQDTAPAPAGAFRRPIRRVVRSSFMAR